jgi:transcriptional regulator
MKKLISAIKKIAVEMILSDEMKDKIVAKLNSKINIPMVSEDREAELIEGIYESMQEAISEAINEK